MGDTMKYFKYCYALLNLFRSAIEADFRSVLHSATSTLCVRHLSLHSFPLRSSGVLQLDAHSKLLITRTLEHNDSHSYDIPAGLPDRVNLMDRQVRLARACQLSFSARAAHQVIVAR